MLSVDKMSQTAIIERPDSLGNFPNWHWQLKTFRQ